MKGNKLNRIFAAGYLSAILILSHLISPCRLFAENDPNSQGEKPQRNWRICKVHPWVEADANQLVVLLRKPCESIQLAGPRNDWLTGAVALAADKSTKVTVELKEPEALKGKIRLRVVGQLKARVEKNWVWDALLEPAELKMLSEKDYGRRCVRNLEQIKDFPTITVTPDKPAFLWLTVDLRNIKSGDYQAELNFSDASGNKISLPVEISVLNAEIPIDNPLYCFAWQSSRDSFLKDWIEHGINVVWTNHEGAKKAGFKFFLFHFGPTFHRRPIDDERKELIKKELDEIKQLTESLNIPQDKWALNLADEVRDDVAENDLKMGEYLKSISPDTQLFYNPAMYRPKSGTRTVTTVDGTLKVIAPVVDIWCPYSQHLWVDTGALEFMKSTKKPMWYYEVWGSSMKPECGRTMLRQGAWYAWQYKLEGFCVYSANAWRGNPWDASDSEVYDKYFTYPAVDRRGLVSTRGFEAFRQGFQEYKRLYVLNKLGANIEMLDSWAKIVTDPSCSVETFDCIRHQMDTLLVELSKGKS